MTDLRRDQNTRNFVASRASYLAAVAQERPDSFNGGFYDHDLRKLGAISRDLPQRIASETGCKDLARRVNYLGRDEHVQQAYVYARQMAEQGEMDVDGITKLLSESTYHVDVVRQIANGMVKYARRLAHDTLERYTILEEEWSESDGSLHKPVDFNVFSIISGYKALDHISKIQQFTSLLSPHYSNKLEMLHERVESYVNAMELVLMRTNKRLLQQTKKRWETYEQRQSNQS